MPNPKTIEKIKEIRESLASKDWNFFLSSIAEVFLATECVDWLEININLPVFGDDANKVFRRSVDRSGTDCITILDLTDGQGSIGSIKLQCCDDKFESNNPFLVNVIPILVTQVYKGHWISNTLDNLTNPIPLNLDEEVFNYQLAETLADCTNARFVVMRKRNVSDFECIAYYDRESPQSSPNAGLLQINKKNNLKLYEYLNKFISDSSKKSYKSVSMLEKNDDVFRSIVELFNHSELECILTVPLISNGDCLGYIGFAFDRKVPLSPILKEVYILLANHIGVTIENYRNSRNSGLPAASGELISLHIAIEAAILSGGRFALLIRGFPDRSCSVSKFPPT